MKFIKLFVVFLLFSSFTGIVSAYNLNAYFRIAPDVKQQIRLSENIDIYFDSTEEDLMLPGAGLSCNILQRLSDGSDPLEGANRVTFSANGYIIDYVCMPIEAIWVAVFPLHVRNGISRAAKNINMPCSLINSLFQGRFAKGGIVLSRFMINTTIGLAGFYDPANTWYELTPFQTNFGKTFQVWGIGRGCYLVVPIIGSTSLRDGVGLTCDYFADPITYIPPFMILNPISWSIRIATRINEMTLNLKTFRKVYKTNYDPYNLTKHLWFFMERNMPAEARNQVL